MQLLGLTIEQATKLNEYLNTRPYQEVKDLIPMFRDMTVVNIIDQAPQEAAPVAAPQAIEDAVVVSEPAPAAESPASAAKPKKARRSKKSNSEKKANESAADAQSTPSADRY